MSALQELRKYSIDVMKKFDAIADDVAGIYDLAVMECEDDCAAEEHECELAYSAIEELIEEYLQK
jgi:hypothetical protein